MKLLFLGTHFFDFNWHPGTHTSTIPDAEDKCVRSNVLEPATRGTINVLQSCVHAGTVRRVVFTSSISTLTAVDTEGRRKAAVDESCLRDLGDVWRTKPVGWVSA